MGSGSFHDISILSYSPEERSEAEKRWVFFQKYLLSKGYRLRPRYQPDWKPSWLGTMKRADDCEDSLDSMPIRVLDATRVRDERQVVIKMLVPTDGDREGEDELHLLQYFSTEPLKDDPRNHVVPCYDSFPIPGVEGGTFVVMPLLSKYSSISFYRLTEVHDFLQQLFEGLMFMHENNTAHCDIASPNIMMDSSSLYAEPFHPFLQHRSIDNSRAIYPQYRRYQKDIRYFYIDLGYAKQFKDTSAPRTIVGSRARERAPEQKRGEPYDPFTADIYQLGAMIRRDLIPGISSLEFLLPLARTMTERDPSARPSLGDAYKTMNKQFLGLSPWRRRWPIVPKDAWWLHRLTFTISGVSAEIFESFNLVIRWLMSWRWSIHVYNFLKSVKFRHL